MLNRTRSENHRQTRPPNSAESEYRFRPGDLRPNAEIRDQIEAMARIRRRSQAKPSTSDDMRVEALRLMRSPPRLIGSVWTGHVPDWFDIDIPHLLRQPGDHHRHPRRLRLPYESREMVIESTARNRSSPHLRGQCPLVTFGLVGPLFLCSRVRPGRASSRLRRGNRAAKQRPRHRPRFRGQACRGPGRPRREPAARSHQPLEASAIPEILPQGGILPGLRQVFERARPEAYDEEVPARRPLLRDIDEAIDPEDTSCWPQSLENVHRADRGQSPTRGRRPAQQHPWATWDPPPAVRGLQGKCSLKNVTRNESPEPSSHPELAGKLAPIEGLADRDKQSKCRMSHRCGKPPTRLQPTVHSWTPGSCQATN